MKATTGSNFSPLQCALDGNHQRIYPILLSAGADCHNLVWEWSHNDSNGERVVDQRNESSYLQKVIDAGGFVNYERLQLEKLTAMLTPTPPTDGRRRSRRRLSPLRRLPPEVLRKIVAYAFHAGYY